MLQVGRNTVREAVRVLSHAKVLEVRQGDGTYVRLNVDPAEVMRRVAHASLRDHFELRALLETEAARRAAARRNDGDVARLEALLEARGERPQDGDLAGFIERDIAFHVAVLRASNNPFFLQFREMVSTALRTSIRFTNQIAGRSANIAEHTAVRDAILAGDPDAAHAAMRGLIVNVLTLIEPTARG